MVGGKPRNSLWMAKKNFKQIQVYNVLIQETNTVLTEQLPTFQVFRKIHTMLSSKHTMVYKSHN
jgi:hypothetical protein